MDITFHGLTIDQAERLIKAFGTVQEVTVAAVPALVEIVAEAPAAETPKPRRGRPPKAKPAEVEAEQPVSATPPWDTPQPTPDEVRAALSGLLSRSGAEVCRDRMRQFGAQRVSELTPDKYADFIKACAAP